MTEKKRRIPTKKNEFNKIDKFLQQGAMFPFFGDKSLAVYNITSKEHKQISEKKLKERFPESQLGAIREMKNILALVGNSNGNAKIDLNELTEQYFKRYFQHDWGSRELLQEFVIVLMYIIEDTFDSLYQSESFVNNVMDEDYQAIWNLIVSHNEEDGLWLEFLDLVESTLGVTFDFILANFKILGPLLIDPQYVNSERLSKMIEEFDDAEKINFEIMLLELVRKEEKQILSQLDNSDSDSDVDVDVTSNQRMENDRKILKSLWQVREQIVKLFKS